MKTLETNIVPQGLSLLAALLTAALTQAAPAPPKVAWLGVVVAPADDILRNQLKLPHGVGLAVQEVVPDSPAAKAGLQAHDLLDRLEGQLLFNVPQFRALVRTYPPGQTITVSFLREGQRFDRSLELGETEAGEPEDLDLSGPGPRFSPDGGVLRWDDGPGALRLWRLDPNVQRPFRESLRLPPAPEHRRTKPVAFVGVELASVEPSLAAQLNLGDNPGVLVRRVMEETPAAKAGLKEHDLILELDGQPVADAKAFATAIRKRQAGDPVRLTLLRGGNRLELEVTLEERQMPEVEDIEILLRRLRDEVPNIKLPKIEVPKIELPKIEVPPAPPRPPGPAPRHVVIHEHITQIAPGAKAQTEGVVGGGPHLAPGPADAATHPEVPVPHTADQRQTRRTIVIRSDTGTLTLEERDGDRRVTAQDAEGNTVFEGPVNTAEEKAKLPPEVREHLDKLDQAQQRIPPPPPVEKLELRPPPLPPDIVRATPGRGAAHY